MTDPHVQVPYATPDLNTRRGRGEDPPVNFFGGLQVILASLIAVPALLALFFGSGGPDPVFDFCMASQPLFYVLLSGLVVAASRPRFIAWRIIAYRVYAIGFFAVDGIALIGFAIADWRGDPIDRFVYWAYPLATLFANPVLVILFCRQFRDFLRPVSDSPPKRGFEVVRITPRPVGPPTGATAEPDAGLDGGSNLDV
jgi:hypothetical protein